MNKKTDYGNIAPRLGLTYDLLRRRQHDPPHRLRHHLLPGAAVRLEHDRPAGAVHDFAERQLRDQSDRLLHHPQRSTIRSPPSRRSSRARPPSSRPRIRACSVTRSRTKRRTPNSGIWASSAALIEAHGGGADVCGKRRQAPGLLLQPERGAAGDRLAGVAATDPAAEPGEQHRAVRSAQPIDLSQRPAEGDAAVQRRAAVPRQLHLRQGARLRRLGGERRRCRRQSTDGHEPRPLVMVRRASTCATAPSSAACGNCRGGPIGGGCAKEAFSVRWSAAGNYPGSARSRPDVHSRCSCRPASTTARRAGRIGSARANSRTRRVDRWYNPADFRRAAGEHLRRQRPRHPLRTRSRQPRHVALEAIRASSGAPTSSSGGTPSTCSITRASASRTRTSTRRQPDGSRRRSWTTDRCSSR